jgi:hypothetical protein|tara:strand:+ start:393 stop:1214 length:822 start_codon:yes stop_codon:yes gene_type:complete
MTHYSLLVGSSGGGLAATSFVELTSGSSTFSVPDGYNAIHIQYAVGGGGGAVRGADYDKAGGESAGAGGGSGAYISDKILTVTEGETITYAIASAGTAGNSGSLYNVSAGNGGNTTLSGSSTGSLFSLVGGGGSSASGGGVQGPLRTNTAGTAGAATISGTAITSGIFSDSDNSVKNVNTNTSGPVGTFNQSGNGAVGVLSGSGNCGGDNCSIAGFDGGDSYAGNIDGGVGSPIGGSSTAGTRGSGGGGGAHPTTNGSVGGAGEIKYRFLQVI